MPRAPRASCVFRHSESPSLAAVPTRVIANHGRRWRNNAYIINGQRVWTSRAEYADLMLMLARTAPAQDGASRTADFRCHGVARAKARGRGIEIRPIRTMMNHSTTEVFFQQRVGTGA